MQRAGRHHDVGGNHVAAAGPQAPALTYPLGGVSQIAEDQSGNLCIADTANSVVLRLDTPSVMRRVAGNGLLV